MKHYGDITKLNGAELPAVDVITGGSPCQDLSVAGKRAGLAGERSGLFMEQIRVIKEMRQRDRDSGRTGVHVRPRYMVWENVPGAFSSNGGEDFRAVLEETAHIADENAAVPQPPNGKWTTSGAIMGDGWSIAWRVLDAQFWGVPQRRRRIALVADFGGQSAPEILFERKGVPGDIAQSGEAGEGTAGVAENGIDSAVKCLNPQDSQSARVYDSDGVWSSLNANSGGGQNRSAVCVRMREGCDGGGKGPLIQKEKSGTLGTGNDQFIAYSFDSLASNSMKSKNPNSGCREVEISKTLDCFDPNPSKNQGGIAIVYAPAICIQGNCIDRADTAGCNGKGWTEDVSYTLNTIDRPAVFDARGNGDCSTAPTLTGDHQNGVTDYTAVCCDYDGNDIAETLDASYYKGAGARNGREREIVAAVDCRNGTENANINGTLQAKESGGMSLNLQNTVRTGCSVRRLTPLECERLQGYPDGWTLIGEPETRKVEIKDEDTGEVIDTIDETVMTYIGSDGKKKKCSDSARYKALGNSIALPPWRWVLLRITAQYERPATLGSLFDGIGGFPLIWERLNGVGTCLWASEIEEFCIAVTRMRFERTVQT